MKSISDGKKAHRASYNRRRAVGPVRVKGYKMKTETLTLGIIGQKKYNFTMLFWKTRFCGCEGNLGGRVGQVCSEQVLVV